MFGINHKSALYKINLELEKQPGSLGGRKRSPWD